MNNFTFELEEENYNYDNIKYQILYYFQNVSEIKFNKDQLQLWYIGEIIDKDTIKNIIDDNILKIKINTKPLVIESNHLSMNDKSYIKEQLTILTDFLKRKKKDELLQDIIIEEKGINMLRNESGKFFELLDKVISSILKKIFKADEYWVPSIIDISELQRSNYLSGSFHHVNFISKVLHNYNNIREFKEQTIIDKVDKSFLTNCRQVLNPAVCLHCYGLLENENIEDKNCIYSLIGKSYRDESGNLNNEIRLKEFTMRELVFIGKKDNTEIIFNKCLEIMNEIGLVLDLDYMLMPANDIFFDDNISNKTVFQKALNNKIEFEVYDEILKSKVSLASTNRHGTHFTKSYNIKIKDELATSMCLAFGYDRIMRVLINKFCC